jgi:hypothetical protein
VVRRAGARRIGLAQIQELVYQFLYLRKTEPKPEPPAPAGAQAAQA